MSIKNILIAHSGSAGFPSSVKHAAKIAAKHDAWLTCVYGNASSYFEHVLGLTEDLLDKLGSARNEKIAAARDLFQQAAAEAGLAERSRFIMPNEIGKMNLPELARNFDFVVTGYHSNLPTDEFRVVSPDMISLQSGRPVLVVPNGYSTDQLASHALVAWDGKRSAARALNDAMTILEEKPRRVTILSVGSSFPKMPEGADILTHLKRHNVDAEHVIRPKSKGGIAEVIQETARELDAKLIVMGAYEHSKFSQDLFGGVTHKVTRTSKVPVFMSH